MLAAYLSKRESFNEAKVSGMEIAFIKKKITPVASVSRRRLLTKWIKGSINHRFDWWGF